MGGTYKLRIQAQCVRQEDKYDPLTQAELQDFFTEQVYKYSVDTRIVKASDKHPELEEISWEGETELGAGISEQDYHNQIKAFLEAQTENAPGLKVKTSWLLLDDYTDVIGDKDV